VPRLRDLGLRIGLLPVGQFNAITDVADVRVGHATVVDADAGINTGVTVVLPRPGHVRMQPLPAGVAVLNGNGDATGLDWVRESGLLTTPIATTNTHSVGVVRDALVADDLRHDPDLSQWSMPVVMETYDGVLNDINGQHVRAEHVHAAVLSASNGIVAEGSVGGGTGMVAHEFKGGIGTSSRLVEAGGGEWTVGVLVQANYGRREDLRVDGLPVGRVIDTTEVPSPFPDDYRLVRAGTGSIVMTVATDAPLLPDQCRRLAMRTYMGLARVGGGCSDSSGDFALAFSTAATDIPSETVHQGLAVRSLDYLPHQVLSPLFAATADATEEAILNAMLTATTTRGPGGRTAYALEPERLLRAVAESRQIAATA
jgi:D-aminopeptidase